MTRLISIKKKEDIIDKYRQTPIELLLEYHNLNRKFDAYSSAKLLIGMCMDNRKHLNIPQLFSYIIRTGGGNLKYNEFKISYAISIGKVQHIALIGHSNCGMVNLDAKKDIFINGLVETAGWKKYDAEAHYLKYSPVFGINNEIDFVLNEAFRLREMYPKICIAPLFYKVEDNLLYIVDED